jgi:UDP-2-acetamido-3-amino-2,3-dideoxy-glucuronate N-acetyltransferase
MKKNIAVVGCGHWGKNLVRNFAELGVLGAVCDPNKGLAESYANQYQVNNLSFDDVLSNSNIDGVVLAVPAPLHAEMAIAAMKSGNHVYVEKPLAMNAAEAGDMIKVAEQNKNQLMVGHLLQYHPVFRELLRRVNAGQIGALSYIYSNRLSFGKVRTEEDVIWSFAPHDISMILSLTNQEPIAVRAETANILHPHIADTATIHMEFSSGVKAHVAVSWLHPFKEQKLVVVGNEGMLVFDDTKSWDQKLALYPHCAKMIESQPVLKKADIELIQVPESEPLQTECAHFVSVVLGEEKPLTDGYEGLRVLNVLSAATESLRLSE